MLWNENIWYSNNKSGDWSAPVELSDAFQNDNDYIVSPSAIAINNQDKICAVWPQCLYNGDRSKLWFNYFDGTSWNGQTQMTSSSISHSGMADETVILCFPE
jgi:hypothetical protein